MKMVNSLSSSSLIMIEIVYWLRRNAACSISLSEAYDQFFVCLRSPKRSFVSSYAKHVISSFIQNGKPRFWYGLSTRALSSNEKSSSKETRNSKEGLSEMQEDSQELLQDSTHLVDVSEEGFSLNYTMEIGPEKIGILDYIRKNKIKRSQREWAHLLPIDDTITFEEFTEKDNEKDKATYRVDQQSKFVSQKRDALPPWVQPIYLPNSRFIEHEDYVSVDGGKLGNKMAEEEIVVDELRVDTRISLKERKYALNENQQQELERLKQLDSDLLKFHGLEYDVTMLLTVGAQGSGKSKFSMDLVEHGSIPWARINQDTIRNGRRGTKTDCAQKARDMMHRGYCVVVDRMNFSPEQRDEFVALANELNCQIHAIVFRLPFVENVYNVASRKNHEGNFEGSSDVHRQIIYATRSRLFNRGHPSYNNERFSSVFECQSNDDYAFAFRQWMLFGKKSTKEEEKYIQESWKQYHQQWRIQDKSKLQQSADLIQQDGILYGVGTMPVIMRESEAQELTPTIHKDTIGYVPSRDGPIDSVPPSKQDDP